MSKRIAIILGSSRGNGDTKQLTDIVRDHVNADVYDLNDYDFSYYDYEHRNRHDDFFPLVSKLIDNYDVFVFATPVYWYTMSAVMKTFLDRFSDLIRIHKDTGRKLRGMQMALISCSPDINPIEEFGRPFERSADYLGMTFLGHAHGCVDSNGVPQEVQEDLRRFAETTLSK